MLECCVWSVFQYGAETWTLKKIRDGKNNIIWAMVLQKAFKDQLEKEKRLMKRCWKKVNWKPKLVQLLMKQKMAYMGHLVRKNNILEQQLTWKIEGKTAWWTPRKFWTDNIKDWTGIQNTGKLITAGRNRRDWHEIVYNLEHTDATWYDMIWHNYISAM